jgi:hypothetical protein
MKGKTMTYEFDAEGEVTNVTPEYDDGELRIYPAESIEVESRPELVATKLCCVLEAGRWEYFISEVKA